MGKKISEMTDAELLEEIARLRAVPMPQAPEPRARRPKRLDEAKPRKRTVFDQLDEE